MTGKFYITTPIYYVNDRPHIGHAYTSTVCDVAARFQRFLGRDVFYLTGTDEHGQKVEKSALERGIEPQALADENAAEFEQVMDLLHITNDDFIRTTQSRHVSQVQTFVKRLLESGDVYLGEYEGWYDEGQEEYVPENRAKDQDYTSVISGKPLVRATEKNYFFRLSAFQDRLAAHIDANPHFIRPDARRNEVLGRIRDGLQDIPMSRTSFKWGIGVPGDEEHVIYVWIDALFNYITALGLGDESLPEAQRRDFWPAQFHVIGKEILFFHAVIWPCVLMALEIPLPQCVYAHSFWISEGRKMSKSLGNFIDLEQIQEYADEFSLDAWRWFMATQGPMGATDADFAQAKFIEVYNTDLANTLGNSINRVANMITKYFDAAVPTPGNHVVEGFDWPTLAGECIDSATSHMDNLEIAAALHSGIELVRHVDAYIDRTKPFSLAKDPDRRDDLATILYNCAEALRIATLPMWCAMPNKIEGAWHVLGQSIDPSKDTLPELAQWGGLQPGTTVVKGDPLFPRYQPPKDANG